MSLFRHLNEVLSPGGPHGKLSILIFHRVLSKPDPMLPFEPDAGIFEARMRKIKQWFNVIPLAEAVDCLANETLPPRALAVTFDDGYADNHDVALPILQGLGMHATFFVATGFLDGGCMWNDRVVEAFRRFPGDALDLTALGQGVVATGSLAERRSAIHRLIEWLKYQPGPRRHELADQLLGIAGVPIPDNLMLSTAQVRQLNRAGMGIGAHTHGHPILARLDRRAGRDEIARSKRLLEEIVEQRVELFAYPNGKPGTDYTRANVEQVRDLGFAGACSTAPGVATRGSDVLQLPRFTPWERAFWRFGLRLSENLRRRKPAVA